MNDQFYGIVFQFWELKHRKSLNFGLKPRLVTMALHLSFTVEKVMEKRREITKDISEHLLQCEIALNQIKNDLSVKSEEQIEEEIEMTKFLLDHLLHLILVAAPVAKSK